MTVAENQWHNLPRAEICALLFAVDPLGFGGVVLRAQPGPPRDGWLQHVRQLLTERGCWRRIPVGISNDRLLGGLDFSATLSTGEPVYMSGVLAASDGGVIELAMAERMQQDRAALLAGVLDQRESEHPSGDVDRRQSCRFGVIAIDEGLEDDDGLDTDLADRLAFQLDSADLVAVTEFSAIASSVVIDDARERLSTIEVSDEVLRSLAVTSASLGISSLRGDLFAIRASKALAALRGESRVSDDDVTLAAQLVLAHRAQYIPMDNSEAENDEQEASDADQSADENEPESSDDDTGQRHLDDVVMEATRAAIPADLLSAAADFRRAADSGRGRGRAGKLKHDRRTGRVVGSMLVDKMPEGRLHLLATLRAALPWQRIRRATDNRAQKIIFAKSDMRVARHKDRNESTTIFVVDASGSQAAQRLSEVKGAIELLIADCYVRRDQVALIAFRKKEAELLLAPTRALARAKRALAEMPAGGGTPLSAGIDQARLLVDVVRRQGRTPQVVFLTDGRANVSRDGSEGHEQATEEAIHAARLFRTLGLRPIVIDTSRRPRPKAREFADALAAAYVPLPQANAASINSIVGQLVST